MISSKFGSQRLKKLMLSFHTLIQYNEFSKFKLLLLKPTLLLQNNDALIFKMGLKAIQLFSFKSKTKYSSTHTKSSLNRMAYTTAVQDTIRYVQHHISLFLECCLIINNHNLTFFFIVMHIILSSMAILLQGDNHNVSLTLRPEARSSLSPC